MGQKFCTYCGNALEPGVKFCTKCGAPVEEPPSMTQEPAPEPDFPEAKVELKVTGVVKDKNGYKDAYGVKYSKDKKILIDGRYQTGEVYQIARGTRVICSHAFDSGSVGKIIIPSSHGIKQENLSCPDRQKRFLSCERTRKSSPKYRKNA